MLAGAGRKGTNPVRLVNLARKHPEESGGLLTAGSREPGWLQAAPSTQGHPTLAGRGNSGCLSHLHVAEKPDSIRKALSQEEPVMSLDAERVATLG